MDPRCSINMAKIHANRNLTRAQIRIQRGEGGGRGTNANARGKIPRRFGQSKREKWEPRITIPGFYPSMPSRLIPYLAIYGTAESVCVEIYRRILKIERRRIGKGFVCSLEETVRGI